MEVGKQVEAGGCNDDRREHDLGDGEVLEIEDAREPVRIAEPAPLQGEAEEDPEQHGQHEAQGIAYLERRNHDQYLRNSAAKRNPLANMAITKTHPARASCDP